MYAKSCFSIKKLISTSERHAGQLFAGQNTQQAYHPSLRVIALHIKYTLTLLAKFWLTELFAQVWSVLEESIHRK